MSWSLLGFVAIYTLIATGLSLAAIGNLILLPHSVILLTVLLLALALGGVFAPLPAQRQFYLAASLLPIFALVRLGLVAALPPPAELFLPYLILGAALAFYARVNYPGTTSVNLRVADLVVNLRYAIPLGSAIGLVELFVFAPQVSYDVGDAWLAAIVAGFIAFLDEYLFRGVLQSQTGAVSRPVIGWLATAVLFVADAAPTGDPTTLIFRAGLGLFLGYLVWRRGRLPLALMIRVVSAVLVALLLPHAVGSVL